jgi:hypothetical protein
MVGVFESCLPHPLTCVPPANGHIVEEDKSLSRRTCTWTLVPDSHPIHAICKNAKLLHGASERGTYVLFPANDLLRINYSLPTADVRLG